MYQKKHLNLETTEQMFAACQSEDVWFNIKFHLSCFHSVFISCMRLGQEHCRNIAIVLAISQLRRNGGVVREQILNLL